MESLSGHHYHDVSAVLLYITAAIFLTYNILQHYTSLTNAAVAVIPAKLLLDRSQRETATSWSQINAAKAESLRNMLGLNSRSIAAPTSLLHRVYSATPSSISNNTPAGLGNWDNSCYQNSILQGLTSLDALQSWIKRWRSNVDDGSTIAAMKEITDKLRSPYQNGKQLWTPAKLKSMSSLQQQDAQEYYSKVVEEMEKEVFKSQKSIVKDGLEVISKQNIRQAKVELDPHHNPLEGMLAQHVVCTSCGFSEGLSLIPYNCLTLPLDNKPEVSLEESLDEYTKLEPITGVECAKCTLLKTQKELKRLAQPANDTFTKMLQLPPELRAQVMQRLQAVDKALESDDFSDDTLSKACQIPKNVRVSSTKTRQALLARMPANLVIHINRSVFDEMTGMLRKNYAAVKYPSVLDLGPWVLGDSRPQVGLPREDLWKYVYRIKAIVTHYGRHENGHYIAYRQAPVYTEEDMLAEKLLDTERKQQWWRLSDETVSKVSEEDVLDQGGVFMLLYERVNAPPPVLDTQLRDTQILHSVAASEASLTEDESEADFEEPPVPVRKPSPPSPLLMRTASAAVPNDELWNVGRYVAAS